MVDFSAFVAEDGLPIYLQIIRHVKRAIAAGTVQAGDELPSRRVLSAQLGVNPNTVQKAYKLLEDEGIISSRSGAKSEIALSPELVEQIRRQLLEQEAGLLVRALRQAGLEKEAALALLERLWDESCEEEGL
ncbi:GntR family transcriptional regulator [Flavonifractor sp. HCP28S3_F3]|uniref:GntR family transcriptional regulator n=1 Tax=Flavonifractor sp. HCP28S3_F3 TaxID=3438939 RepID=UPI003F89E508